MFEIEKYEWMEYPFRGNSKTLGAGESYILDRIDSLEFAIDLASMYSHMNPCDSLEETSWHDHKIRIIEWVDGKAKYH